MTAASKDRLTNQLGTPDDRTMRSFPVRAATPIYAGTIVGLNTSGIAGPASATFSVVVGVCDRQVTGGTSDGDVRVDCASGKYQAGGAGGLAVLGTAFSAADVGTETYAADDSTLTKTSASGQAAGYVHAYQDGVAYVYLGAPKGGVGA